MEEMARPERFELPTLRFVVGLSRTLFGSRMRLARRSHNAQEVESVGILYTCERFEIDGIAL